MKKENKKELTRVPQNVTRNFQIMENSFGSNATLITDILIFLSNVKMKNIFGGVSFSLKEFCDTMGYRREFLQQNLTDEERQEVVGLNKSFPTYKMKTGTNDKYEHVISNRFECAIWQAMEKNVIFQKNTADGKYSMTSVQIIKHFDIYYDYTSEKKSKRIYTIITGNYLQDFMMSNYNLIDLEDYKKLPNTEASKPLYLFLSYILAGVKFKKESGHHSYYDVTVDYMAKIIKTKAKESYHKKMMVKRALEQIQKKIKNTLFSFSFPKVEGKKHNYIVRIEFEDKVLAHFDEKLKAVFFASLLTACKQIFMKDKWGTLTSVDRNKEFDRFFNQIDDEGKFVSRELFWEWFNSDTPDNEQKEKIYNDVFKSTFGCFPHEFFEEDFPL